MKENNKNNEIKVDIANVPSATLSVGAAPTYVTEISSNLHTLSELSAGFSLVMPDLSFMKAYESVVASQAEAFKGTLALSEQFHLAASKGADLLNATVAPFSANIAEIGLVCANALKLIEIGDITKEMSFASMKISSALLEGIAGQQSALASSLDLAGRSGVLDAIDAASASARMVSSGFGTILTSLPAYSPKLTVPSLQLVEKAGKPTGQEISSHQKKLDVMLARIDPTLVTYRQGCWHALRGKGPDYLGQASSSMRRVIDNLVRTLAPNDKVIETEYFKNSVIGDAGKDNKGKPTRKAKILFIIKFEISKGEHLERLTKGFLATYDSLSAWDHAPLDKELFVEGALVASEGYLLSLLSENGI